MLKFLIKLLTNLLTVSFSSRTTPGRVQTGGGSTSQDENVGSFFDFQLEPDRGEHRAHFFGARIGWSASGPY